MYKKCEEILNKLESEGKIKISDYQFPPKQELKLKLRDMLEDDVDEKYYLSKKMMDYMTGINQKPSKFPRAQRFYSNINRKNQNIANSVTTNAGNRPTDNFIRVKNNTKQGYLDAYEGDDVYTNVSTKRGTVQMFNPYNNKEITDIAPTQTTSCGCTTSSATVLKYDGLRIRKLTPKECWRLMGFDDEDFEKAAFKKEISYIEGGKKCNAKLKIVNEKQRLLDTETYVYCTTNDTLDMETQIRTKWKKSIENENNEKMQNVNIAIEMLGDMEQKECATNIIKCGENITILYSLMEELDQHHMAIIELEKRGKANIEKYMKITLEENLNPMKLYTISTLIEQIIKSKIYTCITQKASIQGNIAIIEDCVKNLKMMKLSNLKMEYITRLNSDTMLYKQAGNSIVVNVLEAIFDNLLQEYK